MKTIEICDKKPLGYIHTVTSNDHLEGQVEPVRTLFVSHKDFNIIDERNPEEYIKKAREDYELWGHFSKNPFGPEDAYNKSSIFFQTLHQCFGAHHPFVLSPDAVWFIILNQVGICVNQNPDQYREYFTDSLTKKELEVRDDELPLDNNWMRAINKFLPELKKNIPEATFQLLNIDLSTSSETDKLAHLVAFMDTAQPYYSYTVYSLCGIPKVKLLGTYQDWDTIITRCRNMQTIFLELDAYFENLVGVLTEIRDNTKEDVTNIEFWKSIYTKDEESGGPTSINGWISSFIAYVQFGERKETDSRKPVQPRYLLREKFEWKDEDTSITPENLSSLLSQVPFKWKIGFDEPLDMILCAGFTGNMVDEEGFFEPILGVGVYEVNPKLYEKMQKEKRKEQLKKLEAKS